MSSVSPPVRSRSEDDGPVRRTVPYYSQWESPELVGDIIARRIAAEDDPEWRRSGAESPEEYAFWSWRTCGMACLRMALHHWQGGTPPMMELARDYLAASAYVLRPDGGLDGLIYAPFAARTRERFGLQALTRPDLPPQEVRDQLAAGRLVMLSVHPSVRTPDAEPPRRGGHLVLAVDCSRESVVLHNPSGLHGESQKYAEVPWRKFTRFYAGRGIVLGAHG
ncbi:C39 family peptidase [Streptacidiphilus albus]|uniref:C39 family peptidase n=1 Tax=Streptacidiphilus albus TaxID=105425 RepID=UPI0009DE759F|nr:C39 family peptidase [Streptacidiphilus albus]